MKESYKRVISGSVYGLIFILSLHNNLTFALLTFSFGIICTYEFNKLLKQRGGKLYITFTIFYVFFIVLENYFNRNEIYNSFFNDLKGSLVILTIFISIFLLRDLFSSRDFPKFLSKKYYNFIFYISCAFVFIFLIGNLNGEYSPSIILGCFIIIWVNDSFAYIIGKRFGKQKLFYSISPHKTVEGFLGGLFFSCISASFVSAFINDSFTTQNWLITAIIISVFGTLGDLIESKFKRELKVKDSGSILPGHGGMLDRLDSIIFATPYIYFYLKLI